MLTVHRGERGAHGAASAMASHLQQQTLPPEQHAALHGALDSDQLEAGALSAAVPRRDTEPRLAALLGVNPRRTLEHIEVVRLLTGQRADGLPVPVRPSLNPTRTPGAALRLDPVRPPDGDEIRHLLAGRRADGAGLAAADVRGAKRALGVLGVPPGHAPTADELDRLSSGLRLDGSPLRWSKASQSLFTPRIAVAYLGLCFSAHKSLSVAWAMAPIPSEAALLVQSHRDAVAAALLRVEAEIGRARRGRGGAAGYDPGSILWVQFHHYTARPTPGIDEFGEAREGSQASADPAGSPQVHTHAVIPNVTVTADGHVGGLDLQRLRGRVKEFGALYHAHLATALRRLGAEVALDPETGAAQLLGVPGHVWEPFSRRTTEGTRAARRYAGEAGLDWDGLAPARKVALIKLGTQGDPRAPKSDDVGDWGAWRRQADALGWTPQTLLRPDRPVGLPDAADRVWIAHEAASAMLREALRRTGSLDEAEVRTAAARGLVASGIGAPGDLELVVQRIIRHGVQDGETAAPLAWSTAMDAYGQAWGRLAGAQEAGTSAECDEGRADTGRDGARPAVQLPVADVTGIAKLIDRLRGEGRAAMLLGGFGGLVEGIADLWQARHEAHRGDPAYQLAVIADLPGPARDIAQAIRCRRQRLGLLAQDQVCIDAADGTGSGFELRLAPGDRVRLGRHVNADDSRGIIGRAGSVVDLLLIEAAGVTLRTRQGRTGRVGWQRLRDPRSGRILLAHAGALAIGDVRDWAAGADCILALTAGSGQRRLPEALTRPGGDAGLFLVLSEEAEQGQLAVEMDFSVAPADTDTLWAKAAANLARPEGAAAFTALRRRGLEARLRAVRTQLASAHASERRQAAGLEPATLHRTLQRQRDEAALLASPAILDRPQEVLELGEVLQGAIAAVMDAASHGVAGIGHLIAAARARRARLVAPVTLHLHLHRQQEAEAMLQAMGVLRPATELDAALATVPAALERAAAYGLADMGRLTALVRERRAAWLARTTLRLRLEGRHEAEAVLAAIKGMNAAVLLRTQALAQLPALTASLQAALVQGGVSAGHSVVDALTARRTAWRESTTLSLGLERRRELGAGRDALLALRPALEARGRALDALLPITATSIEDAVRGGLGDMTRLLRRVRDRRTAWLERATLSHRLARRRELAAAVDALLALRPVLEARGRALDALLPITATGIQEAVRSGLGDMARLLRRVRDRRAAWLERATLSHGLARRRELAAAADALLALRPVLEARERALDALLPITAAGVEHAVVGGLSGLGRLLRQVKERRAARLAWTPPRFNILREGIQTASGKARLQAGATPITPVHAVPASAATRPAAMVPGVPPAARAVQSEPDVIEGADGVWRVVAPPAAQGAKPTRLAATPPAAPADRVDKRILASSRVAQVQRGEGQRPSSPQDVTSSRQTSRAEQSPYQASPVPPVSPRQAASTATAPPLPAPPYTSDEATALLLTGGEIVVDREGLARITNPRPTRAEAPADTELSSDLFAAGVKRLHRHIDRDTRAISHWYRKADLVALLVRAGRVAADAWALRLRAAAARGRAAEQAMDAAASQEAAGTKAGQPSAAAAPAAPAPTQDVSAQDVPKQRQDAPAAPATGEAGPGTTQGKRDDQLQQQLLGASDVVYVDAARKAWVKLAPGRQPALQFFTLSRVHKGPAKTDKAGKIGLHGLGVELAAIGVPARIVPQKDSLIAVLIDVGALAAALARLTQLEIEGWLARLRHAARQSRNLHRSRTGPGSDDLGL